MGWKDAPLVESGWRSAPLVEEEPKGESFGESHLGQGTSGFVEGLINASDFASMLLTGGALRDQGKNTHRLLSDLGIISAPSDDPTKQFVRRTAETVGGSIPFGFGGGARAMGATLLSGLTGGAAAATSEQLLPGNEWAEIAAEVAGSLTPMTLQALLARIGARTAAPTVQQLQDDAGRLYEMAENSGVTFDAGTVGAKVNDIAARAISEGIDPTIHPAATAALKRLEDAAKTGLTVKEARTLRKVIAAAEKDFHNVDQQRIAGIMRRQFDELLNTIPELAPANALYKRAAKGDMIETAIELAGSRAGQFSGSGFENALRTEFRALERQIIKGQLKGLSDAEIAAIKKVANGGTIENALRALGKLAPTGVVSLATSGGVPFFVGNAIGGPAVGAAASATTMGLGMAGRAGATALQKRNAAVASALMRRGGPATLPPFLTDTNKRIAAAILSNAL